MSRNILEQAPDAIWLLTNRTHQARFRLRPGEEVNKIILSVLAYVADKYDVEIFAFVFMSNHFHIMARASALNLHHFMRDLQSQIAKRLNKHWNRENQFFGGRYTPTRLLDDEMQIEKLCYTLCNPCLSNLVSHPRLWPGLSSWSIHQTGQPLVGQKVNHKEKWRLIRKKNGLSDAQCIKKATVEYPLEMAKLPVWEHLDDEAYRERVCEVVQDYARHLAEERTVPCMGAKKVCAQDPNGRPREPKKSPRPLCLASDPELRDEYIEAHRHTTDLYKQAVGKLRKGKTDVKFPYGTIPPGHTCCVGAQPPDTTFAAAA